MRGVFTCLALCLARLVHFAQAFEVTCGSTLKLKHNRVGAYLYSQEVQYGQGSGQQTVTGLFDQDNAGEYWGIMTAPGQQACEPGQPLRKGQKVRMHHTETKRWLHSHNFRSPLTQQWEVSAYGSPRQSDTGDTWAVTWDGKSDVWDSSAKVYFQHVDTGRWLAMSGSEYPRPIAGHKEVACAERRDKEATAWVAAEGVYLPHRPAVAEGGGDSGAGAAATPAGGTSREEL